MSNVIYLDYNATTPVDPRVLKEMLPYFTDRFGNAASRNHSLGWEAEEAVKQARTRISDLINVEADEIVFTSGATESNNLAIKGVFDLYHRKGRHIITAKTEHRAVLDVCEALERQGAEVTYLDVDEAGMIDLVQLESAIRPDTVLVSIMWANNETGVIQPMQDIGVICARNGTLLMSDATQAVGKIPVHPREVGIHLLSFSAHKMYGPKGVGALFVNARRPRVKVRAQMDGGGHEGGMRSGTLNVPAIVGFGKAAQICLEEMEEEAVRLGKLRDELERNLEGRVEAVQINGHREKRLPHVSNLSFQHVDGEGLMIAINQQIAVSSGSACTSATLDPSHVLTAMGLSESLAHSSIRVSFGRFSRSQDVAMACDAIEKAVDALRAESPVWEMYKEGML